MSNLTIHEVFVMCEGFMEQYAAPGIDPVPVYETNTKVEISKVFSFESNRCAGLVVTGKEVGIMEINRDEIIKKTYKYETVKELFEQLQRFYPIETTTIPLLTQYHTWVYLKNRVAKDTEEFTKSVWFHSAIGDCVMSYFQGLMLQETARTDLIKRLSAAVDKKLDVYITSVEPEESYFGGGTSKNAQIQLQQVSKIKATFVAGQWEDAALKTLRTRAALVKVQRQEADVYLQATENETKLEKKEVAWINDINKKMREYYNDTCLFKADIQTLKSSLRDTIDAAIRTNISIPPVIKCELDLWRALDTLVETI